MYFFIPDFYGKNNLEKAYIDQILDTIQDLAIAATPYILEKHENKAKKVNLFQNICDTYIVSHWLKANTHANLSIWCPHTQGIQL